MLSSHINYVDFHCHCDLLPGFASETFQLNEDVAAVAVTTTPLAWSKNVEVSKRTVGIYPALGMHPQLVGSRYDDHFSFSQFVNGTPIIGEIGLDGSQAYKQTLDMQEAVFSHILELCSEEKIERLMSIHSLKSEVRLIKHFQKYVSSALYTPVFHWFTGSVTQASKLLDMGAKFSINHKMVGTKGGQDLLSHIPKESVLIETDIPFTTKNLSPENHRSLLMETVRKISTIWSMAEEECSALILRNSSEILSRVQNQ